MRYGVVGMFTLAVIGATTAQAGSANMSAWRLAQSENACLINCSAENESCKRTCPTTYAGPCLSACDNQAQFCRQSCQRK
jgi:hypothetical protein